MYFIKTLKYFTEFQRYCFFQK